MTRAARSAREWLGQQVPLSRDTASEIEPRLGARVCLLKQPNDASLLFVGALRCSPGSVWCRGSAAGWPASTLGRGVIPQLCMPLPGCRRVPCSSGCATCLPDIQLFAESWKKISKFEALHESTQQNGKLKSALGQQFSCKGL